MANSKNIKKKFQNFGLRLNLFRIWFLKNLLTFVIITAVILVVLILTGAIPETTPLIGDIFRPLIIDIREIFDFNRIIFC